MNIKYLTFITLVFIMSSCKNNSETSNSNQTENDSSMKTDQKKLTGFGEDYTVAWNSKNPENVASFFSENGVLVVNSGLPHKGRAEISEFVKGFMTAFPDMKLTMDSLTIKPTETQYHWSFAGTNTGPNGTGNKVFFNGFERWTFSENEKIQRSIGSFDEEDYSRQMNGINLE